MIERLRSTLSSFDATQRALTRFSRTLRFVIERLWWPAENRRKFHRSVISLARVLRLRATKVSAIGRIARVRRRPALSIVGYGCGFSGLCYRVAT
jgi:hypothetical protein